MGFCDKAIADLLSHLIAHGYEHLPLNSSNNFSIQIACIFVVASAPYSASVVESAVHSCFFVAYAIIPLLCRKACPVVLYLSSKHPAQSPSEKATNPAFSPFLYSSPRSIVPLTYLKILLAAL